MRAATVVILGTITVEAHKLKSLLGKAMLAQPGVEVSTSLTDFTTVLGSIILHMIYGQYISIGLTTANTDTSVS
jgi:hypothetical protein